MIRSPVCPGGLCFHRCLYYSTAGSGTLPSRLRILNAIDVPRRIAYNETIPAGEVPAP